MLHVRWGLLIAVIFAILGVAVWNSPQSFYTRQDCASEPDLVQASGEVSDTVLQNLASRAFIDQDYHTALGLFTQLIHRYPDDGMRYIARGEVFFAQEDYHCALADREMAVKLMPDNLQARGHRAHVNYLLGRCSETIDDGMVIITREPGNPHHVFLFTMLGDCLVKLGKVDDAIALYDTHMVSPEYSIELYKGRGIVQFQTGQYTDAIADFTHALKVNADDGYMMDLLTKSYVAVGQLQEGIQTFTDVIERVPNHQAALDYRGDLHFYAGEYDAAIADYNRVIALDPDSAYAFLDRGRAYGGAGDFEAMMHNLEFAYMLEPVGIGGILCRFWEFFPDTVVQRKALRYFTTYIRAHPAKDFGYIGRSAIYLANKQYRLATRDLKPLVALFPENVSYREALEFALMGGCHLNDDQDYQIVQTTTGNETCQA